MIGRTVNKCALMAIIGAMLACACTLAFATQQSAHAAELAAGEQATSQVQPGTGISAAAKSKVSVRVVSSMKVKMRGYAKSTSKLKFSYNKKGQLVKVTNSGKVKAKYRYKKKTLVSSWRDGGQGAPSNIVYSYQGGKLSKSYDTVNRHTVLFSVGDGGLLASSTDIWSPTNSVATYYNRDERGLIASIRFSTWTYDNLTMSYDDKGNPTQAVENVNDNTSWYKTTKYKNVYKAGRLAKVVKNYVDYGYRDVVSVKYKRIKVPASYAKIVKRQQRDVLLENIYNAGVSFYGLPLGFF